MSFRDDLGLTYSLPHSVLLCLDSFIILDAFDPNGDIYEWSTGANTEQIRIMEGGDYSVTVSNDCSVRTESVSVTVDNCIDCNIYVPNAFQTIGAANLQNSNFVISSNCQLFDYNIRIFDRWGNIHFQSTDPNILWDGRSMDGNEVIPGIYVYSMSYSFVEFGQLITQTRQGDILIVR